jgi:Clp amino terminal domain, pathogenicity island component
MFDRFTERARQVIFFARYEAGSLGSNVIDTEHLLLGLVRQDKVLALQLPSGAGEAIRSRIEQLLPHPKPPISKAIDMPLSFASKRVLAYAAEEAERLTDESIDSGHLVLGLLRENECLAATMLHEFGLDLDNCREIIGKVVPMEAPKPIAELTLPERDPAAAPSLRETISALEQLVGQTRRHLKRYLDVYGEQRLKRKPWTRKEALGHLVDWAVIHQVWLARALTEPRLVAVEYPVDDWVLAQQYGKCVWQEIVDLWVSLNGLLIHVLAQIPEEKLGLECRIGIREPIPLSKLIERYLEHCQDIVGQILAHL